jgi:hypothetical protein
MKIACSSKKVLGVYVTLIQTYTKKCSIPPTRIYFGMIIRTQILPLAVEREFSHAHTDKIEVHESSGYSCNKNTAGTVAIIIIIMGDVETHAI